VHYATSWKVMGSIPDKVIGFFNWSVALRSTQPPTDISTGNLPGDKVWTAYKAYLTSFCELIV
jgi:hypothetical protein